MIQLVIANATIKAFDSYGSLYGAWPTGGGTWQGSIPRGHYALGKPYFFETEDDSAKGQVEVGDLNVDQLYTLVKSGRSVVNGTSADIGGITLPLGQLGAAGESIATISGAGPDWEKLADWVAERFKDNVIVYSVVGDD